MKEFAIILLLICVLVVFPGIMAYASWSYGQHKRPWE